MYWILVVFCSVFSLLSSGNIYAENVKMDEIVVTATRTEVQGAVIPGSVTVITSKEIEARQVSTVPDLLRDVPGLDVVQRGGLGGSTTVSMRGGNAGHTLVLIDGVRVNSLTLGFFDFADLTVDNIERVEIIRGPLSTLYGSDAISGVIQIFTKKAKGSSGTLSLEVGSYGTMRETISTELNKDQYNLSLTASRMDAEGFSALKAGAEKDGYKNTTVSSRIGINRGGATRIDLTARLTEAMTELDQDFGGDDPNYQQERHLGVIGMSLSSAVTGTWNQKITFSSSIDRLLGLDEDTPFNRYTIDLGIRTAEWQHNISTGEENHLTLGYEWRHNIGENQGNFSRSFTNQAVYLQDQRGIGSQLQLLAGIRWDGSTAFENAFTYRVGASYLQSESVKFHGQYGTGFKGPTLNDLFFPGYGNLNLKPEKSSGWEVGIEQALSDKVSISLIYYKNTFKDLITFVVTDPITFFGEPQNVGRAVSSGLEGKARWEIASFLQLTGNYTYNDTEDREKGGYLTLRPLNKYTVDIKIGGPNRNIGIHFLHVGQRFYSSGNQIPLSAYNRIDLLGSYRLTDRFETFGRIENLLDREYEETKGYSTPGFSAYGGLRMTF